MICTVGLFFLFRRAWHQAKFPTAIAKISSTYATLCDSASLRLPIVRISWTLGLPHLFRVVGSVPREDEIED